MANFVVTCVFRVAALAVFLRVSFRLQSLMRKFHIYEYQKERKEGSLMKLTVLSTIVLAERIIMKFLRFYIRDFEIEDGEYLYCSCFDNPLVDSVY
mmetsp:Transcript_527/g.1025  ORF Transcript_527/g.1025 Transcript_527/m.1025 type:complete len:96 (+) Transcript_527:730-1017(+)